jgi:hypothetical protein
MPLQLRDNVYWCDCTGRAVFLDVEADRYFCLPSEANAAFLRLAAGEPEPRDAERLQMLVLRGILIGGDASEAIAPPPIIEAMDGDVADEWQASPGLISILRELVSELVALRLLRARTFSEVIEAIRRDGSDDRGPPRDLDSALQAIAGASNAASYLMRVQDRCLVRALAVHLICMRRGIRSKLVFGVIAHPFAAHCWVQLGNKVLVGGFEHARLYTPIFVLE